MSDKFLATFAGVILATWVFVVGAAVLTKDYTVIQVVTPIMFTVTGFLFGAKALSSRNGKNGNGKGGS